MDKSIIIDIGAFAGLFLFTGAEVGIEGSILELISKAGVIAVLWFWLKHMKSQMKEQLENFNEETKMLRQDHKDSFTQFKEIHKEHQDLLNAQLNSKDDIIKSLQDKIRD